MKITHTPISYPSYLNEDKNKTEKDENNPANTPSSYEVAPEKSDEESRGNTGFQPDYLLHQQRQKERILSTVDNQKKRVKRGADDVIVVRASPVTPLNPLSGFSSLENLYPTFGNPAFDYAIKQEAFMKGKLNEEENHARTLLKKSNSLAIIGNSAQIAPVLSSAGAGSLVLTNPSGVSLLNQFTNAINTLNASASRLLSSAAANLAPLSAAADTAAMAVSRGFVVASILYPPKAGEGSDLAQGKTLDQFLSLSIPAKTIGLNDKQQLHQATTTGEIALPVRGRLVMSNDKVEVMAVRPQNATPVKVISAVKDAASGLYVHSLPKTNAQSASIQVVTAPSITSSLEGQPPLVSSLPRTPVSVRSPFSDATQISASGAIPFQDAILVYPEAANMEPVYVMYGARSQNTIEQAQKGLAIANQSLDTINRQYQTELAALNRLKATPEGRTLSNPAKYPLTYQQSSQQLSKTQRIIAIKDKSLVDILLGKGISAYSTEVMKRENSKASFNNVPAIVITKDAYENLGRRLLDTNKKISQQTTRLQTFTTSRQQAQARITAAEAKLKNELNQLLTANQGIKSPNNPYYPPPATQLLTDYLGLQASPAKTPLDDGVSQKPRWANTTGDTIYEWNSLNGSLETYKPGHWETEIGKGGKEARVWVVESVINPATGLYGITLPDEQGNQGRTILISPINAPGTQGLGPLLHPEKQQVVILNTGNNQPVKTPIVRVYPNLIPPDVETPVTVPPLENGYQPLYVMFNNHYGETNAKGKYSGRYFHTDRAGGPILNLDWRTAIIDQAGINKVKLHTSRFGDAPENRVMIDRLEKISQGKMQATDIDKRFYTHEIRELERYRNLGIKDGEIPQNKFEVWNNTHTATLEDYRINEKMQPLYTPDAIEASREAEEYK